MNVRNSSGYTVVLTPTPPAPDLLPLGTIVTSHMASRERGMVIGYNGDRSSLFYPVSRYPYVILWEDGYFEVYGPESFEVIP